MNDRKRRKKLGGRAQKQPFRYSFLSTNLMLLIDEQQPSNEVEEHKGDNVIAYSVLWLVIGQW